MKNKSTFIWNRRMLLLLVLVVSVALLLAIAVIGVMMPDSAYEVNFENRNRSPYAAHIFGTDWMGRDMLARSLKGLSTSIFLGMTAAFMSSVIAVILGTVSAVMGKTADQAVIWLVDMVQGIPQMIMLMLISFLMGKGVKGLIIALSLTHWPALSRVIRAEVLSVKNSQFVLASRKMGKSRIFIGIRHILPYIIPQYIVGVVLLFPHAILHEASLTFLGFGLSPEQPAMGVILSESMRYLTSGYWWLTVLPGASLLLVVLLFDAVGDNLRVFLDPYSAQD